MKALVIYDSLYGHTEKIAQAIGDVLARAVGMPDSIGVIRVGDVHPDQLVREEKITP